MSERVATACSSNVLATIYGCTHTLACTLRYTMFYVPLRLHVEVRRAPSAADQQQHDYSRALAPVAAVGSIGLRLILRPFKGIDL